MGQFSVLSHLGGIMLVVNTDNRFQLILAGHLVVMREKALLSVRYTLDLSPFQAITPNKRPFSFKKKAQFNTNEITQLQYLPTVIKSLFTLMSAAILLPCTHAQAWYCRKVLHNFSKHKHSAFDNSHMTTVFILNCWVPLFVANVVHKLDILDAFHFSKGFYHGQCHALKNMFFVTEFSGH